MGLLRPPRRKTIAMLDIQGTIGGAARRTFEHSRPMAPRRDASTRAVVLHIGPQDDGTAASDLITQTVTRLWSPKRRGRHRTRVTAIKDCMIRSSFTLVRRTEYNRQRK